MTDDTDCLILNGLREDILRDFLATLGLLERVSFLFSEDQPRISWDESSGHPRLHSSARLPSDWARQVLDSIRGWRELEPNPFGLGKIEAIQPTTIRELLAQPERALVRFYGGLFSQLDHDGAGRRSELIIESANRSVLKGVDDLLGSSRISLDLEADLAGTSSKREVSNTSRWHPAEYQPAAYVATDPKDNKHQDRLGLNILALFGTAFYPVLDTKHGRTTPGFRRVNRANEFLWPIWNAPLSIDEVRGLITHPLCFADPPRSSDLVALGVRQVWRSRKFQPDGKNDYFSSAMLA